MLLQYAGFVRYLKNILNAIAIPYCTLFKDSFGRYYNTMVYTHCTLFKDCFERYTTCLRLDSNQRPLYQKPNALSIGLKRHLIYV